MNRREFVPLAAAGLLAGYAGFRGGRQAVPRKDARSAVSIKKVTSYDEDLPAVLLAGLRASGVEAQGKRVLLKPQLAELRRDGFANTHAAVVAAAYAAFRELGAAEVWIGDAPEFHRDTAAAMEAAGYRDRVPNFDDVFVDLHGDDVTAVAGVAGGDLYLPSTALRADLVVSLAKLKTDPTLGVSLSMPNLLGLIPGQVYGWQREATRSIGPARLTTELTRAFRRSFGIVDGVWGMEGPGAQGKAAGIIAMGSDLAAVDASCCRVMGLDPDDVEYLSLAANREGVIDESRIDQLGEPIAAVRAPFRMAL